MSFPIFNRSTGETINFDTKEEEGQLFDIDSITGKIKLIQ